MPVQALLLWLPPRMPPVPGATLISAMKSRERPVIENVRRNVLLLAFIAAESRVTSGVGHKTVGGSVKPEDAPERIYLFPIGFSQLSTRSGDLELSSMADNRK
jgi:hypothetical protein